MRLLADPNRFPAGSRDPLSVLKASEASKEADTARSRLKNKSSYFPGGHYPGHFV